MTTEQIQTAMLESIARRDELVKDAQKLFIEASECEHRYRLAQAKAYLKADGKNADERRGQVDQMVSDEMHAYKIADAKAYGVKEAIAAEKDKLSAYQSLLRLQITELDALRFGQHNQV